MAQQGKQQWKRFQDQIKSGLESAERQGLLGHVYQIPDGLVHLPGGRSVHAYPGPADFAGWLPDGLGLLVEAKRTEGKSLPVMPAGKTGPGLKDLQRRCLIRLTMAGGLGLLVCEFQEAGCWALDGLGLEAWSQGDDVKGNLGSISLEHFRFHGWSLGPAGRAVFPVDIWRSPVRYNQKKEKERVA